MPSRLVVFLLLGLLILAVALPAGAITYNPATTIVVFVHGSDPQGHERLGVFGDEIFSTPDGRDPTTVTLAQVLGQPTCWDDPDAANQVCAVEYYGNQAGMYPTWYSQAMKDADAATTDGIPRYAKRLARYIDHVLQRAPGATDVCLVGGSMGALVCRYMIEQGCWGYANVREKISRLALVSPCIQGSWGATGTNLPQWIKDQLTGGTDAPELPQIAYNWVDANISAHSTLNSTYYAPMVIQSFITTHDIIFDYCQQYSAQDLFWMLMNDPTIDPLYKLLFGPTASFLCEVLYAYFSTYGGPIGIYSHCPNDGLLLTSEQKFASASTEAAKHMTVEGTPIMPGTTCIRKAHGQIGDDLGFRASLLSFLHGNKRVRVKVTRFKVLDAGDAVSIPDWVPTGEWTLQAKVTSPRAAALWGYTAPLQDWSRKDGQSPLWRLARNGQVTPNLVIFDQIVPPGETTLSLTIKADELDGRAGPGSGNGYYPCFDLGVDVDTYEWIFNGRWSGDATKASFTTNLSLAGLNTITLSNSVVQMDVQTAIWTMY